MASDSGHELKLISLLSQLVSLEDSGPEVIILVITQIISLVSSMGMDSQPKPESELMSLITQSVSIFNSMDLDLQPDPLRKLISFISQNLGSEQKMVVHDSELMTMAGQNLALKPEPELESLIHQIFSLVISMYSKSTKFISLCPQIQVRFENGKFHHVIEQVSCNSNDKWNCLPLNWDKFRLVGEDATLFFCRGCNGENHKEYAKASFEIKHNLHPKHSLQLVLSHHYGRTRECYCCDEYLNELFYYCSACDLAINLACVEKPPVLSIDHPKWHEHTLALFPRYTSLTCDICALADSNSPFYLCSPCGFAIHQKCTSLPHVIRISRHHHRISFTHSFHQGDWSCGVCRRKMDNDYGGYSCTKEDCLFAAHSKCATQRNVWDSVELEGELDEEEKQVEAPFERICDGIIQHFIHQHHHLKLDCNTYTDYDKNMICQACVRPTFSGNIYSCLECDHFLLHVACANLSRNRHHPIHPHLLTLVIGYDSVINPTKPCSACPWSYTAGYFYQCSEEECDFRLHVQCAIMSEPLFYDSHMHPLFLTSKPEEERICSVCKESGHCSTNETFNCIDCDFTLCFKCATVPQRAINMYDKHVLIYEKEISGGITHWCEECERKIEQGVRFYICYECCVSVHAGCMLGVDLYTMPGSS
ncbi:PREDICTED: uncharacterized protein LOC104760367 [Camelina sativa]|uniref:Uncharacterized protein LOC104760367 n=1 Tax=Camelina sativa TaxID=90675 RepID=A0ABM1R9L4_CAMSA|nr:PREDICTED: uncharacterized protein LOC104760367 [Camelina sativa]